MLWLILFIYFSVLGFVIYAIHAICFWVNTIYPGFPVNLATILFTVVLLGCTAQVSIRG